MRLLDLYCCQGGASAGYHRAGFEVFGVDWVDQPRYPFPFLRGDALGLSPQFLQTFDAVHASPPCQAHTNAQKIRGREHPDLIDATRAMLQGLGVPYVIENVPGAPLEDPIELCGAMFGIATYRHRWFELGGGLTIDDVPAHPEHRARTAKMGRPARADENMHIVGNFSGVERARDVMGMPWANRDGLREAIPPVYAEWIGQRLMAVVRARAA